MDFDFSDDQEQLRDAVRKWVDKGYDFERRRAIVKAGGFDRTAYNELAELMVLAQAGKVTLHTKTYPLDAAAQALSDLDAGLVRGRAILVP